MQVTRSLALSSEPSGGLICIKGRQLGAHDIAARRQDNDLWKGPGRMQHCVEWQPGQSVALPDYIYRGAGAVPHRGFFQNGTFLGDETRLQSGKEYHVKSATEIYLGNSDNLYKLKWHKGQKEEEKCFVVIAEITFRMEAMSVLAAGNRSQEQEPWHIRDGRHELTIFLRH